MIVKSWIVLIPPLATLIAAFVTKKVARSLLIGIITASFIASFIWSGTFSLDMTLRISTARLWANTGLGSVLYLIFGDSNVGQWLQTKSLADPQGSFNNAYVFAFLLLLGALVSLISHTGGACAYAQKIKKSLKNAKNTETATLLLSTLLFLDDYLSSLTVGCVMRPLTDKFKIPRAKLAFLIDSMAAPLIVLIPISSWVAVITNQLSMSGISDNIMQRPFILADPFYVYTQLIPYIFYSFIIIATTWFIVRNRISFGSMNTHETIAQKEGNLFGGKKPLTSAINACQINNSSLFDFIFPITLLIFSVVIGLMYSGGASTLGGTHSFVQALQNADSFPVLFWASVITLATSIIVAWYRKRISLTLIPKMLREGFELMGPSVIVLILAWTFSELLKNHLHTGEYLAYLMIGTINIKLLPVMFFITSAIISITIGSSWGTVLVMFPIAIPMLMQFVHAYHTIALNMVPILLPILGAILSGAVAGDHISPIASTTIMTTSSSGCYLLDHVQTQLTYALPAILATGVAFLISGLMIQLPYWTNIAVSLSSGMSICLIALYIMNKKNK